MTTKNQSILEKLKAAHEALKNDYDMCLITKDDGRCWAIDFSGPECEDIHQLFLSLPRLIEALEWVEDEQGRLEKALEENPNNLFSTEQIALSVVIQQLKARLEGEK
jgi:hypothetical protein